MKFSTFHLMAQPEGFSSGQIIAETLEEIELAEMLGYDRVWLTEHHASRHGICSAPSVMAAAVAARTETIGIGYAVNVTPLHQPLRLAEEIAWVDQLSKGRVVAGFGTGYSPYEFARYGVEVAERYARHEEGVEVVLQAWRQERFDYAGKYYQYRDACVLPRPYQEPHPPIAATAGSEEGARHVGTRGFRLLTLGGRAQIERVAKAYAEGLALGGHDAAVVAANLEELGVLRHIYVAASDAVAIAAVREKTRWLLQMLDQLATVDGAGSGGDLDVEEYVRTRVIAGSPETVATALRDLQGVGVGQVLGWFRWGTMTSEETRESMRLFAAEVAPPIKENAR